jgi:ADP-heptose:LPS heptosyltransferase
LFPKWQQIASTELKVSIIPLDESLMLEYKFNRQFFEAVLEEKWNDLPPNIDLKHSTDLKIGIFPGAAHKSKRWSVAKLNKLLKLILKHYPQYEIVILGSSADLNRSSEIVKGLEKNSQLINKTGTTNLVELIEEIATCEVLITNDTSAFHISCALEIKTIIIANGVNHKRFIEFPNKKVVPVYPQSFIKELKKGKYDKILKAEAFSKEIQEIKVKTVFDALVNLLNVPMIDTLV